MSLKFLSTLDLPIAGSSILKTNANGEIVAAVAGTDYLSSINSSMVTTALGYTPVPTTRTLTINGTALDLSANRSWTISTITGNAGSATVLQTARTINGTSFNGSANITTANWGTARTITIGNTGKSVNGSANLSWTLAEIGAQAALTNPVTGTGTTNYLPKFTGSTTIGNSQVFDNGTNVGIGTTAPAYKLDVNGNARAGGMTLNAFATGTSGGNLELGFDGTHGVVQAYNRTTGWIPLYLSGDDIRFNPQGTERMRITSAGNVGIGTTAPTYKLDVNGNARVTSTMFFGANAQSYIGYVDADSYYRANGIHYFEGNGSYKGVWNASGNLGIGTTAPSSKLDITSTNGDHLRLSFNSSYYWELGREAADGRLSFTDSQNGEVVTIQPNGNVGIGTTAPGYKLDVNGDVRAYKASGEVQSILRIGTTDFYAFHNDSAYGLYTTDYGSLLLRVKSTGLLNIYDKIYLASSGNVGIGTTAPSSKFEVYDSANSNTFTITSDGANEQFRIRRYSNTNEQLIIGFHSSDYGYIQTVEQAVAYRPLSLNPNGGNVGIGTTSPSYNLDVSGSARVNSTSNLAMFIRTNSAFGAAISYEDSTTGGNDVISAGAIGGDFYISTNYSERMRITSGGNVGIGTTAPAQKLHVVGSRILVQDATNAGLMINTGGVNRYSVASTGSAFQIYDEANSTNRLYITSDGNIGIGTISPSLTATNRRILSVNGTSSSLIELKVGDLWKGYLYRDVNRMEIYDSSAIDLSTNGSIRATITSAGNVGIGTTAPSSKLDVQLSSYDGITLSRAAQSGGSYIQGRSYDTSNVFRTSARIALGAVAATNAADGFITFNTYSANTENERMRITSAGNVGIGTTSPTNQLTVTTATNAVDVVRLNNTGGDSGSVQGVTHLAINHFNSGTNPSTRITAYQDGVSGWPGGMYFSTRSLNTDSAPVERMRITSTGNVGIGTSSPNALYRTTITTGAGQTGALQTTGSVNINSGALAVGSITPSGTAGRIDASNDIVAFSTSDKRLKENITPIANALDKVKSLTGVEFDWKEETKDVHGHEGHDVGVIAQEVQAVLPEAVRTNDSGYLSVRYEKMIALLVEAMKEQQNQIDELKAQLRGNS